MQSLATSNNPADKEDLAGQNGRGVGKVGREEGGIRP